ncbi:hypothetical protein [Lactiplantibacillus mudanjiangensis]|uniref:Uncharacterized protein n=1 Tax=Lactiplantibacillus mudanjiangensis TaxID=1296538 RepID=A0A660E613_9LACO|nr:hypothetical protein [Lactiplantibacillus mudanjiangensis]VDG17504.1 hypothetical protein [Lactobacillus paracollinoides] [Lactiplantibacillus mudanjiangensis]VDG24682.1 hypothetical protein [Lactobacillus paracollinoides] [Lactiplantibacillus mudanjiangensis]VDG27707.1 hypothetical protein [Lactobacillus paracollinoides] [Lactiplantibacillus mudanjiangensis]VDG32816.1 hypothetical protein [Lactobacillus paracollinoides] [Lactiplantibacillus mudanjiangensis]
MKKLMKRLILSLTVAGTLAGTLSIVSANAQASAKVYNISETTSSDGTHYFTVDGKYYTPEAYAAWEATLPYNKYGYDSAKLKATKNKSGKSIKVTGKVKVLNPNLAKKHQATYVRIKTYKGNQYAKLTKSMTFSKTVKVPKAKSISVQAGYYSSAKKNGKTVKTFHVTGLSEKVTVK